MSKPYSSEYVIRETLRHMQQSIAISTQKTITRIPEFAEDPAKLKEVMDTLASLSRLNQLIESIKESNREILGE
jgi:hypothetical protein